MRVSNLTIANHLPSSPKTAPVVSTGCQETRLHRAQSLPGHHCKHTIPQRTVVELSEVFHTDLADIFWVCVHTQHTTPLLGILTRADQCGKLRA